MSGELAFAVTRSGNAKIGEASVTYAAQASCPDDCVFRGAGCYAEGGWVAQVATRPLNASARDEDADGVDVAIAEAEAIDLMDVIPGRPLRLHTVGDCASDEAAEIVAGAAERYMLRGGGPVWTYTHAWRVVSRSSWGEVSVFASCETPEDVLEADLRKYAAAIVVESFLSDKAYPLVGVDVEAPPRHTYEGRSIVPCPAQTRGTNCADCGLCFRDRARRNAAKVIGFALHGDALTMRRAQATLTGELAPASSRAFIERFLEARDDWPSIETVVVATGVSRASAGQMLKRMKDEARYG